MPPIGFSPPLGHDARKTASSAAEPDSYSPFAPTAHGESCGRSRGCTAAPQAASASMWCTQVGIGRWPLTVP